MQCSYTRQQANEVWIRDIDRGEPVEPRYLQFTKAANDLNLPNSLLIDEFLNYPEEG